jgi:hypothetical protein
MFDLFGESVPTPLAHISIPEIETPAVEQYGWEEELLGVALSSANRVQDLIRGSDPETITSGRQLVAELAGKKVVLAGQVASSVQRFTREQKPFTIATLALLDGTVDVFIWEDRLAATQGLWEEGTLVTVAGTVRSRNDQVSITCLSAVAYEVSDDGRSGARQDGTPSPDDAPANGHAARRSGLGVIPPAVAPEAVAPAGGQGSGNGSLPANAETYTERAARSLTLRIRETDSAEHDRRLFGDVRRLLVEYRGEAEVNLEIALDGRIVTLEWSVVRVDICPELEKGLRDLLGSRGQVLVDGPAL